MKILPFVIIAIIFKAIVHVNHIEVFSLSPLFSGVVGATVFLLGFMIAGTLTDYKESERLPTDLAASLHSIADECAMISSNKGKKATAACLRNLDDITKSVLSWLRNNTLSDKIFANIEQLNKSFLELEPHIQATFLNRLKNEQNQARRMLLRMRTIRETSFVGTGYAIAELSTGILLLGLIFTKNQPYPESLFFVGFIAFFLTYMIALISDLDNPFDYSQESEGNEISLKPLEELRSRVRQSK